MQIYYEDDQACLFDPESYAGKTCPVHCHRTADGTSNPCCARSRDTPESRSKNGETRDSSKDGTDSTTVGIVVVQYRLRKFVDFAECCGFDSRAFRRKRKSSYPRKQVQ